MKTRLPTIFMLMVVSLVLATWVVLNSASTTEHKEKILLAVGTDVALAKGEFTEKFKSTIKEINAGEERFRNEGDLAFFSPLTSVWATAGWTIQGEQIKSEPEIDKIFENREAITALSMLTRVKTYLLASKIAISNDPSSNPSLNNFLKDLEDGLQLKQGKLKTSERIDNAIGKIEEIISNTPSGSKMDEEVPKEALQNIEQPTGLSYLLLSGIHMFFPDPGKIKEELEIAGFEINEGTIFELYNTDTFSSNRISLKVVEIEETKEKKFGSDLAILKYSWGKNIPALTDYLFPETNPDFKELLLITDGKFGRSDPQNAAPLISYFKKDKSISSRLMIQGASNSDVHEDFLSLLGSNSSYLENISENRDDKSRRFWKGSLLAIMMSDSDSFESRRFGEEMDITLGGNGNYENGSVKYNDQEKMLTASRMKIEDYNALKKGVFGGIRSKFSKNLFLNRIVMSVPESIVLLDESKLLSLYLENTAVYNFHMSPTLSVISPKDWKEKMFNIYSDPRFLNEIYDYVGWDYVDELDDIDAINNNIVDANAIKKHNKKGVYVSEKKPQDTIYFNKIIFSPLAPMPSEPLWSADLFYRLQEGNKLGFWNFYLPLFGSGIKRLFPPGTTLAEENGWAAGSFFLTKEFGKRKDDKVYFSHTFTTWNAYKKSYKTVMETAPNVVQNAIKDAITQYVRKETEKASKEDANPVFRESYSGYLKTKITDNSKEINHSLADIKKYLQNLSFLVVILAVLLIALIAVFMHYLRKRAEKPGKRKKNGSWVLINMVLFLIISIAIIPVYHIFVRPVLFAIHDIRVLTKYEAQLREKESPGESESEEDNELEMALANYLKQVFRSAKVIKTENYLIKLFAIFLFFLLSLIVIRLRLGQRDISGKSYLDWGNIILNFCIFLFVAMLLLKPALHSEFGFKTDTQGNLILLVLLPLLFLTALVILLTETKKVNRVQRTALIANHYAPRNKLSLQRWIDMIFSFGMLVVLLIHLAMLVLYVRPTKTSTIEGFYLLTESLRRYIFIIFLFIGTLGNLFFMARKTKAANNRHLIG